MNIPNSLHVTAHAENRLSVGWDDEKNNRRYHFWIDDNGRGNVCLHSNPLRERDPRINTHRSLFKNAKKWAPLIAAIMEKIKADDLIRKAHAHRIEREKTEEAKSIKLANEKTLAQFERAIGLLPYELASDLRGLPEEKRLEFVYSIRNST